MISFIVIGKNEGWKLTKSIESIYKAVEENRLNAYEIVYVDSASSDDSIERALAFKEVRIFKINGPNNAAMARNIGAGESRGESLFFIDGDMEIDPNFLKQVFDEQGGLKYDCVTGHLEDIFYDHSHKFIGRFPRTFKTSLPTESEILTANGGIFLIRRPVWEQVKGMRTKYRRSQDIDLTLRLAAHKTKTIRVPHLIALHHTIDYTDDKRMWQLLFSGAENYTSLLLRDHLFNCQLVLHIARNNYTALLMALAAIGSALSITLAPVFWLVYSCALVSRTIANSLKTVTSKVKLAYFFERMVYLILRDIMFWIAFLLFFPTEKEVNYTKIKS